MRDHRLRNMIEAIVCGHYILVHHTVHGAQESGLTETQLVYNLPEQGQDRKATYEISPSSNVPTTGCCQFFQITRTHLLRLYQTWHEPAENSGVTWNQMKYISWSQRFEHHRRFGFNGNRVSMYLNSSLGCNWVYLLRGEADLLQVIQLHYPDDCNDKMD